MKIVVLAETVAYDILRINNLDANWVRVESIESFAAHPDAGAFFDLSTHTGIPVYPESTNPLFINSVLYPIGPNNKIIRINGWDGFLQQSSWEIAGILTEEARKVLEYLGKKVIQTADEPGFISARIIAMIINEAYYAKEENVSTEAEIDTAMKLGTNYPYGPFEWAEKIGLQNICSLLSVLTVKDKRYSPAPLLVKTAEHA
jgi:3-hydroxybutyryl-CoA dehydrogenase